MIQDQTANSGSVTFWPTEAKEGKLEITAKIEPDGSYKMKTNGKEGVPPGTYKVTASAWIAPSTEAPKYDPSQQYDWSKAKETKVPEPYLVLRANARYSSQEATDLSFVVPSPSYDLKLVP